jgi:hypothetical protein
MDDSGERLLTWDPIRAGWRMKKEPQNARAFSAGVPIACRIAVWSIACSSAWRALGLSKAQWWCVFQARKRSCERSCRDS